MNILAFDIIYCCTVYDLFDGVSYTKRNMKEKQLYLAEKAKAESLKKDFEKAKADMDALENALEYFVGAISVDRPGFAEKVGEHRDVLKRYESIPRALEYAVKALGPYEEYLE